MQLYQAEPLAQFEQVEFTALVDLIRGQLTKPVTVNVNDDVRVLWVLRDLLGVTGPKYGCGINVCKACTCHVNGKAATMCSIPVAAVKGQSITTIEGLSKDGSHPLQKAWVELDVPQCGYCQSGQIMAAASLLKRKPKPTDKDIDEAMTNICRCGTYQRIRAAIHLAAKTGKGVGSVIHMVSDAGELIEPTTAQA